MNPTFFKISKLAQSQMTPVTSMNTKDVKSNFSEDGLFSTTIFGDIGSPERMKTFSYIKLNSFIISPHLYYELTKLSAFYKEILQGRVYAEWDIEENIFVPSDYVDGKTGYAFFTKHVKDIEWARTDSIKRDQKIELVKKFEDQLLLDNYLVIPAGIRDRIISKGKEVEDEINPLYRKLLGLSFLLENSDGLHESNDAIRVRMQNTIQEIYNLIITINNGKGGFLRGKWTKRFIKHGTRNVITASTHKIKDIDTGRILGMNDSIVGLYQYSMGIGNKLDFLVRKEFITRIFGDGNLDTYNLVNPKTLKFESVDSVSSEASKFLSLEGLHSKIIKKLRILTYAHEPIMVGKFNLCLIYDDGINIRPVFDNALPEGFDRKFLRPITNIDLISLSVLRDSRDAVGLMTRYPVTGQGSIFPTMIYVKSTIEHRNIKVLDEVWNEDYSLDNFPIHNDQPYTSMAIHHTKLGNSGADHDGDKLSLTILLSKDAKAQTLRLMRTVSNLIRPNGSWINPIKNSITGYVLKHITRGLKKKGD